MDYVYKLENLDCANCAAKVEAAVSKLDGVNSCTVNFITQKILLKTGSDMDDNFFSRIKKAVQKVDSAIKIK